MALFQEGFESPTEVKPPARTAFCLLPPSILMFLSPNIIYPIVKDYTVSAKWAEFICAIFVGLYCRLFCSNHMSRKWYKNFLAALTFVVTWFVLPSTRQIFLSRFEASFDRNTADTISYSISYAIICVLAGGVIETIAIYQPKSRKINKQTNKQNIPLINTYSVWKKGKYIITFACGGALLGSLSGYNFISIIGALIGGVYGLVFHEVSNSVLNNNFFNRVIFSKNLFKHGEHMIALASGGAFLGGIIAQLPGSIIGALAGAIVSLFTLENII
uniref:Uncharacterized protein n=1 Tax=Nostoc flagelliforme str. Sunitezuoqi TaxID=676037 RepID=E7DPS3_9NOSO|nr:hypothetical protein Nfla_4102 [Nostoc flagelliforme str. Sunitezuoqi]